MKIQDFIKNTFGYTPKEIYQFTLPTDSKTQNQQQFKTAKNNQKNHKKSQQT